MELVIGLGVGVIIVGGGLFYGYRKYLGGKPADAGILDVDAPSAEQQKITELAVQMTESDNAADITVNEIIIAEIKDAGMTSVVDLSPDRVSDVVAGYKAATNPLPSPVVVDEPMVHVEEPERKVYVIDVGNVPDDKITESVNAIASAMATAEAAPLAVAEPEPLQVVVPIPKAKPKAKPTAKKTTKKATKKPTAKKKK